MALGWLVLSLPERLSPSLPLECRECFLLLDLLESATICGPTEAPGMRPTKIRDFSLRPNGVRQHIFYVVSVTRLGAKSTSADRKRFVEVGYLRS